MQGHRSYDLMLNLQLGIRYTITAGAKLPYAAGLSDEELFRDDKLWLRFPREGSEVTPPHPSTGASASMKRAQGGCQAVGAALSD